MSSYNMIGFSEDSDVTLLSVGFVIIIAYLVVAEQSLSWLDEACRSTAYAQAVQSLYKELVIMGISGFILTVLLGTNVVPASAWVFYMEIADVTLFFSALLHVFFSFSLILHNVSRNRSLKEKLTVNVHQLVEEISTSTTFKWNPFSDLRAQLELRVLRIMFLKQFKLDRAFDFARYITLSEDHHIIEMLHVSPLQWSVVVALIAVNFLRVKYQLDIHLFNAFVMRLCDEEDENLIKECETATYQCLLFTILIYVFLVVLAVMAVTTRLYLLRLMRINGPQKSSEYCSYLLADEVHEVQGDDPEDDGRMSLQHMKQTIQDMKKLHETREIRKKDGNSGKYNAADLRARSRTVQVPALKPRSLKALNRAKTAPEPPEAGATETEEDVIANGTTTSPRRSSIFEDMLGVVSRRRSSVRQSIITQQHIVFITYSGIQSGLFLFDAAWLYFSVRDICNLLLCLYYAFYLATIIAVSTKTIDSLQWNILCAVALVVATVLQAYVIQASSTINAVSTFSSDVVGRVIEEQEEDKEIESTIRDKILRKVKQVVGAKDGTNISRLKKAVGQLFTEIQNLDGISDNLVSKEELKVLLQRLNIFFSKNKFDRAFEIIDVDMSGTITLSEFVDFIFPDAAREARIQSRILKLQAKGLISDSRRRTNDGLINEAGGKYKKTKKFIKRVLHVNHIFGKSASEKKYEASATTENIGDAEEVVEYREKQKNIQARNQVNRTKLKKHFMKKAAIRDSGNAVGHTDKLYNTLTASGLLLSKYRNQPMQSSEKETSVKLEGNTNSEPDAAVERNNEVADEPESAVTPFIAPIEDTQQKSAGESPPLIDVMSKDVSEVDEPPAVVSEFKEVSPISAQVDIEPVMQRAKWLENGAGSIEGSLESIRM